MGISGEKGVYRQLQLHDVECRLGDSYSAIYEQELANARVLYRRLDGFRPDVVYVWNMHGVSKSLLLGLQDQGTPIVYDLYENFGFVLNDSNGEDTVWKLDITNYENKNKLINIKNDEK